MKNSYPWLVVVEENRDGHFYGWEFHRTYAEAVKDRENLVHMHSRWGVFVVFVGSAAIKTARGREVST